MKLNSLNPKHLFLIIILISFVFCSIISFATYYIAYWPTDSWHLYIPAAKALKNFDFISDMHFYNKFNSLHSKEFLVVCISFAQKLLNDYDSLFPNILVLIIAVFISSIIIFLIFKSWFGKIAAFWGSFLLISCFWPYQYVIQGAHQPLALTNLLLAIYFLVKSKNSNIRLILSGVFLGLLFFSSPTSIVYMAYFLGAYVFTYHDQFNRAEVRNTFIKTTLMLMGFLIIFLIFTFPRPIEILKGYLSFIKNSQSLNDFNQPQYAFGILENAISKRGAGISWIINYMLLIEPVLFVFFLISIGYLLFFSFKDNNKTPLWAILIGLSTPIIVEISQVAQFGRNYFSWLIGIIFLITFTIDFFLRKHWPKLTHKTKRLVLILFSIFLTGNLWSNYSIFTNDVFPSRMATRNIYKWLKSNNINTIYILKDHMYTINTVAFLNNPKYKDKINIVPIDSIKDAEKGFILVAPITGKSIWANCQAYDFKDDPYLIQLLDSGEMPSYIVKTFKTLASSKVWTQEEEYCAYLDLHLKQITLLDRVKGMIFILDAEKLHNRFKPN